MACSRRLSVLRRHLQTSPCSGSTPTLTVTPPIALVDEQVEIVLDGLKPHQTVTIGALVKENSLLFESRGVFKADRHGTVNNRNTESIAGTFTGIKPMGLFWSLIPKIGQRLFKKDVLTPLRYELAVYNGQMSDTTDLTSAVPVATTVVERWYKKPSVKRIPLTNSPFRGTVFLPEGPGPFPAIVDMYGGLVKLSESRAALLASHGYATFALCYLYADGLPTKFSENPVIHIKEATEWFYQQDYVDQERFGMLGLCYGGFLSLVTTSLLPQVKTVVNISGVPIFGGNNIMEQADTEGNPWPDGTKVWEKDGGIVIKDIWKCSNPTPIPVWQHGAKVLQISGMEDTQVDTKLHVFSAESVPTEFKANFKQLFYPGAGHLIDPPYTPHVSSILADKGKMKSLDFLPENLQDKALLTGGNAVDHAAAQEHAWQQILEFLEHNLKCPNSHSASSGISSRNS